jgi:hypothetical protein
MIDVFIPLNYNITTAATKAGITLRVTAPT